MKIEKPAYRAPVGVRFPEEFEKVLTKRVKEKRKKFPRYTVQDAIRSLVVEGLKKRGYLDKSKDYL